MRILYWGTPTYALPCLDALVAAGHGLVGVVSQPDRRRGRGGQLQPSPVKSRATELGLPVWTPQNIGQEIGLQEELAQLGADVFVVVAFGQILPPSVLDQPRWGCWNAHGSLLPRWRGAAPIQRAIMAGDPITGVAIMAMEEGLDRGPVLLQRSVTIGLAENAQTLGQRLSQLTASTMVEAMALIAAGHQGDAVAQPTTGITYAAKVRKDELQLSWSTSTMALHRQVMGLYPQAVTRWQGQQLKIGATIPLLPQEAAALATIYGTPIMELAHTPWPKAQPGQVVSLVPDQGLVVTTGDGALLVQEAQLAGKKWCSRSQLLQSLKAEVGQQLG